MVEESNGYRFDDDDAYDTPTTSTRSQKQKGDQQSKKKDQPSTSKGPRGTGGNAGKGPRDAGRDSDSDSDGGSSGGVAGVLVSEEEMKKIKFFDQIVPKVMKLAGVPTVHVSRGDKTCTICKKTYTRTSMLRAHVEKFHLGKGKFQCDGCDKTFIEKKMLEAHKEKEHRGGGFPCDTCGKLFMTEKIKSNHEELHLNKEKNIPCSIEGCTIKFRLDRYRKEHESHCRYNPNRLEYPCPHCTRTFFQRKQLTRHIKEDHKGV